MTAALKASKHTIYGCYAWLILGTIIVACTVALFVTPGIGRRRHLAHWSARLFFFLVGSPVKVEGTTIRESCVVIANHSSYLDGIILTAALPPKFTYIIKQEMTKIPVAGFVLPHCPFFAPRELYEYYYERVDVPQPNARQRKREPPAITNFKKRRRLHQPLPVERIKVARAAYFGLCEYFDRKVGQILDVLDETGLSESTLVIYCSDHGEMAGEHGLWSKSNYYEAAVSVPLIARLPGVIPAGVVNERICNLVDLGPTMVEMGKGMPMPTSDGRSMWPMLCGDELPGTARLDVGFKYPIGIE